MPKRTFAPALWRIATGCFSRGGPLSGLLIAGVMAAFPVAADAQFTAYNDIGATAPYGNVTAITSSNGNNTGFGLLKNYDTGANTGVTLTVTATNVSASLTSGVTDFQGGDALAEFGTIVDNNGYLNADNAADKVVCVFTGLDPTKRYTVVLTGARSNSSYTSRTALFTLSDVDAFTNASSAGTIFSGGGDPTCEFNTGDNTTASTGYVARFTNIQPGSDGDMTVTVNAGPNNGDGSRWYFNQLKLVESLPPNAVSITPPQINSVVGGATINGKVSIPADSNADAPVHVTLTSSDPAIVDMVGATDGVLALTFAQGGPVEQNVQFDIGQAGEASITSENDAALMNSTQPVSISAGAITLDTASVTGPSGAIRPVTVSITPGSNDTRPVQVTLSSGDPAVADLVDGSGTVQVLNFPQGGPTQQTVNLWLASVGQASVAITNDGGLTNPADLSVTVEPGEVTVNPTFLSNLPNSIRPLKVTISAGANDTRAVQVTLISNDPSVADFVGATNGILQLDFLQGAENVQTVEVRLGAVVDQATTIDIVNNGGLTNPAGIPVSVVSRRSWIIPIQELQGGVNGPDPRTSWQMVPTGGYDNGVRPATGSYPLDGRYYWRLWDPGLVWQRVYWKFDAEDIPSKPRLYTVECWVPYLGADDPRSWKQIDVYIQDRNTPSDRNSAMVPRNSHNQWIARGLLAPGETTGGWKSAGPGPNAPDGPACDAGSGGYYLWLKKGSELYMDGSTASGFKYGVSALRITEVDSPIPVCQAVSDGPVDLRCVGNADPLYTIGEGYGKGPEGNVDGNTFAVTDYRWPCNEGNSNIQPLLHGLPYDPQFPQEAIYTAHVPAEDVSFKLRYDGMNSMKWRNDQTGTFSKHNVFTLNGTPDREFISGHFGRLYVLSAKGGGSNGKLRIEAVYSEGPSDIVEAQLYDWFNQDGDAGSMAVGKDGYLRSEGEYVIGFERLNSDGLAPGGWGPGDNGGGHNGAFFFVHPVELDRTRTLTQVKISLADVENFGGELVVVGVTLVATPCSIPVFDTVGGEPAGLGPDGSVDMSDFGVFQACFTGPNMYTNSDCRCLDVNADGRIDNTDLASFDACYTGPALGPPPPGCDQPLP